MPATHIHRCLRKSGAAGVIQIRCYRNLYPYESETSRLLDHLGDLEYAVCWMARLEAEHFREANSRGCHDGCCKAPDRSSPHSTLSLACTLCHGYPPRYSQCGVECEDRPTSMPQPQAAPAGTTRQTQTSYCYYRLQRSRKVLL